MTVGREPIGYGRQDIQPDDIQAVVQCLKGEFLTQGPGVSQFEQTVCDATGAQFAVAVANGTAALHLAYLAAGLGPGDIGISPAISFVATSNAMLFCGARVEFADVDPSTGLISLDSLEEVVERLAKTGERPKLIAPVDLTGQVADLARLAAIARNCEAVVVQDAAHSLGAHYDAEGRSHRVGSGAHAAATALSFHPVKHITTGEGGAVLCNDRDLHERLARLRTHGIHKDPRRMTRAIDDPFFGPWYYEQDALGYNYRITDIQCALGSSQMGRLPRFIERRREIARRYDQFLASSRAGEVLQPLARTTKSGHAFHLYVVQLRPRGNEAIESIALRRRAIFLALADQGINCQVHYIPIPWQPFYVRHPLVAQGKFPGAETYYACSISIPIFPAMTDSDVERVCAALEVACGVPQR